MHAVVIVCSMSECFLGCILIPWTCSSTLAVWIWKEKRFHGFSSSLFLRLSIGLSIPPSFSALSAFCFPMQSRSLSSSLFILPPLHLHLPLHSHFISLFLSFSLSAYSKSWTNKQAVGGLRLLSIIQDSQTTARMFAKHMKCISRHRKRKGICFTIMTWTRYTESIPMLNWKITIMFMTFLLCFDRKHTREGQGWSHREDQICFEAEIHLNFNRFSLKKLNLHLYKMYKIIKKCSSSL